VKTNRIDSDPPYPVVCPGDTVQWTIRHQCQGCEQKNVKVKIDTRHLKSNLADEHDFFKTGGWFGWSHCKPDVKLDYNDTKLMAEVCVVKNGPNLSDKPDSGCYKYDISGTYDIDPEAEVQGGNGEGRPPCSSPTPSPSPNR
jgi:hypothetical protein